MFFLFEPFYYFLDPPLSPILTNLSCGSSHFTSCFFRAALDCLPESNFYAFECRYESHHVCTMGLSAEFITGTVFAAVMVIIGLGAIWIVRWQTYFLLNHQSMFSTRLTSAKCEIPFRL
jgi:hypothetical protein